MVVRVFAATLATISAPTVLCYGESAKQNLKLKRSGNARIHFREAAVIGSKMSPEDEVPVIAG